MEVLSTYSHLTVCFVSDQAPDDRWRKIEGNYPNVIYLECCVEDAQEIRRTSIDHAYHVVILTWLVENSNIQDFGMLPIAKLIEENFPDTPLTM